MELFSVIVFWLRAPSLIGRGTRTTVYWTFLSELPNDLVMNLKAGGSVQSPLEKNLKEEEENK
jgi:hypothetical protein